MSLLYRNGTGRNSISFGGNNTTSLNYLRRTSTGRNNIQWYTISSNGTYNILERYNTSRNGIRWNNIVFSFKKDIIQKMMEPFIQGARDTVIGMISTNKRDKCQNVRTYFDSNINGYTVRDSVSRSGYYQFSYNRICCLYDDYTDYESWYNTLIPVVNDKNFTIRALVSTNSERFTKTIKNLYITDVYYYENINSATGIVRSRSSYIEFEDINGNDFYIGDGIGDGSKFTIYLD